KSASAGRTWSGGELDWPADRRRYQIWRLGLSPARGFRYHLGPTRRRAEPALGGSTGGNCQRDADATTDRLHCRRRNRHWDDAVVIAPGLTLAGGRGRNGSPGGLIKSSSDTP